jgi:hypothetical protein
MHLCFLFLFSILGCGLSLHDVWMLRSRWPIRCLMANEVERGFLECGVVLLLIWPIYQPRRFQRCLCGL